MAGSKHDRSGGSGGGGGGGGGGGEVSPLATQLQQAWLHTQMPKTQKRSLISAPSRQSKSSPDQSAFKSLSSIFPELAALPQDKKPMIFSVFQEGEQPKPEDLEARKDSFSSCPSFFANITERVANSTSSTPPPSLPHRSLSASHVVQSSSSNSSERGAALASFLTTHSFSGSSSHASVAADTNSPDCTESTHSGEGGEVAGSLFNLPADLDPVDSSVTSEGEDTNTFYSYLNNLMDDEPEHHKCMFMEATAFQAMAKELGDLIGDDSLPAWSDSRTSEKDQDVDSWLEEIMRGPFPAEVPEEIKDSSKSFTNDEVESLDLGNGDPWYNATDVHRHPEAAGPLRMHPSLDSESLSGGSEDALKHSHVPNRLDSHDSKSTISQQISIGHQISPVDLNQLLLRCAQAVEQNDFSHTNELIADLRQYSSAYGNGPQRVAHYFMEALVAKMSGTGGQLYTALSNNCPSAAEMLKAYRLFVGCCPFIQFSHYFGNSAILHAFGDAKRVHIVDYGILYGVQWPCLIYHLSQLPGGPPHLRITGIDRPQPGFRPSERIQETGHRLARVADQFGVPFEFHAIAEKWEAITPAHLFLRNDEVLAVNCIFRLRHLLDESVMAASPRNLVLSRIRSMNPKIFVQGIINGGYNAPFFMSRFQEALSHFSTLFEALDASMPAEHPDRVLLEQEFFGRDILNIVACEGLERVERAETYRQWQARTLRAGFTQMPIMKTTVEKISNLMRGFHRNYGIGEDGGWLLAGWKETILQAFSTWQPTPISP